MIHASASITMYISFSQPLQHTTPSCVYMTPHLARIISRGRLHAVAVVAALSLPPRLAVYTTNNKAVRPEGSWDEQKGDDAIVCSLVEVSTFVTSMDVV